MSDKAETESQAVNTNATPTDLRTKLKHTLAAEYETAMSSKEGLTTDLRNRLVGLVRDEQVTTEAILKIINAD